MKVIQKDHKLESYKLDYVASFFIREDIKKVEIKENDCVLLKATIAEHRRDRYKNEPLTYLNRVVVRKNMGTKENPKIVFGEEGIERGSANKTWQEQIAEEDVA